MKKVNYAAAKIDVYVQEGAFGSERKIGGMECNGYFYGEKYYTVTSISLEKDRVVIHYKR